MSDFDRHLTVGKQYGALLSSVIFLITFEITSLFSTSIQAGLIAGVLGTVAAVLPDVDHQDSKPRQKAGTLASGGLLAGVGSLPLIAPDLLWDVGSTVAETTQLNLDRHGLGMATVVVVAVVVIRVGGPFFDGLTTHRGGTHSPLFAVGLFVLYYLAIGAYAASIGGPGLACSPLQELISVTGAAGVFVHIWEDT